MPKKSQWKPGIDYCDKGGFWMYQEMESAVHGPMWKSQAKDRAVTWPLIENSNVKVKFKEHTCEAVFGKYANGRVSITLVDSGETIAIATVNLVDSCIESDEVIIKDWSENKGMLDALIKAGIVAEPDKYEQTGHVIAFICKLLKKG